MNAGNGSLLLPDGARLLHIGPHKTGTTSLQSAFHVARREAAAQGVHYAGPNRQPMQAAHAITGKPSPYADGKTPSRRRWRDLVREVEGAAGKRVVISSEGFADADDDGIRTVIADLGGDRVHVVVTLRPLASILPSQWQQYVQGGMTLAYETWLDAMLNQSPGSISPSFWVRHRHDALVKRWAAVAGPSNVSVIVADEADRDRPLRLFESLTGLLDGTLVPENDLSNRSLRLPEIETVRAFNLAYRAEGLGTMLHTKVMRFGAAEHLKRRVPGANEPRIETPAWALERADAVAREIVDGIARSGVRVIGDLESLAAPTAAASTDGGITADAAWADIGAQTAMGIVLASGLARGSQAAAGADVAWPDGSVGRLEAPPRARVEPLELARISTPLLGLVLLRRLAAGLVSRVPLPRRGS
ncbi:MAG TPA: hypothetical protein VMQ65_01890 [Candidatus Limnocylindria bacterium]|nr:hypothetical protein [Candidatus Limnocylindria bacterium]